MSQQAKVTEVFDRFAGEAREALHRERDPALDNRKFNWLLAVCTPEARKRS
jgi:hypothetical protein